MKKKLLLIVLPALMTLSSCASVNNATEQQKGNFFKEEANACLDVFNDSDAFELKTKAPFKSAAADMAEPIIGVQYRAKYNISLTETPDYRVAVRFVAAIKTLDVNVTWTRSVYQGDGTRYGTEASYETTKAYTSLNSNNTPIYPSSFGVGYNYFVAYTLYDIPYSAKDDYSITAYVTLSDTAEPAVLDSVNSKVAAARIGGGVAKYDLDKDNGYFLMGEIGGVKGTIVNQDYPTRNSNKATFTAVFAEDDNFVICQLDTNKVRIFNSDCIDDVRDHFAEGDEKAIRAEDGGRMRLYLNDSYRLYAGDPFTPTGTTYYIRGAVNSWNCADGYELQTDGGDCQGVIYNVELPVGDFKIGNSSWSAQWGFADGYKNKRITGPVESRFTGDYNSADQNIYCNTAGTYNIMLKNDHTIWIWEA